MPGDQCDNQQVISEWQKQKRRIHHTHEKWAEVAEVKQKTEERAEEV